MMIALVVSSGACGADTDGAPVDPADTPTLTEPTESIEAPSATVVSSSHPSIGRASIPVADASDLPSMEIVASLGYPRDLLDRGRVNLKVSRDDATEFAIVDRRLVADHFTPAAVEERRTLLPPDGRVVALQTRFGDVDDCDSPDPVTADLVVTFTYGDDPTLKTASFLLTDASTLDDIRLQTCTVRRVLADNGIELSNPVVDDESMTVDLVISRRDGTARLGLDAIKGTVLFGVATAVEPGAPERVLEPDETEATVPLTIDVNRCDSHAVAETTRKYGIDLYVSVEGGESQRIDVPVEPIVADLETMLDGCTARTGQ